MKEFFNCINIALDKGKTKTLTATVSPSYATNKTLRWETGDASVATVSQSGVVTARGAGTTCICAYSQDGSNKISCKRQGDGSLISFEDRATVLCPDKIVSI